MVVCFWRLTGVPFAGLVIGPIFGINLPFSSAFLIVGRRYWRTRPIRHLFLFFGGGSCHRRFRLNVPRNGRTHFVVSMEDQHFCIGQGILSEMVVGQNPGILSTLK